MGQCCCGPAKTDATSQNPPRPRSRRRQRRDKSSASAKLQNGHDGAVVGLSQVNLAEHPATNGTSGNEHNRGSDDEDYRSCRDDFSMTDGSHLESISQPSSPRASGILHTLHSKVARAGHSQSHNQQQQQQQEQHNEPELETAEQSLQGDSETDTEASEANGAEHSPPRFAGCIPLLSSHPVGGGASQRHSADGTPSSGHHSVGRSRRPGEKPEAGCSMQARDNSMSAMDVSFCYEDASHSPFNIRSLDYMKSKVKQPSNGSLYQLVTADIFAMPKKQHHIAKLVQLPPHGPPIMAGDVALPPIIIFNLQLPLYTATLFGPQDGEGVSIVFYFKLPDDFDPAKFENQKALNLFKRWVTNGREADGSSTRDRLKLIPRVVNVDEWVEKGPLSHAEHKLLVTYNDKPILSRPQHTYINGRGYLEVDLDLHSYTFLARRAITSYLQRLPQVVWENAFVVQGNAADELPEYLIGVARIFRFDFKQAKPIPAIKSGHVEAEQHASAT